MVLKSLELQGFKSFPDKTVLKFDKGMTAIVGPNGSGKSNISDAVRWVLGEQSTKNLRGAKMEDVIFGGTSKRKALGYAEVTLRLDNTDRSLEIDEDEVAVTRRYYRSGEGEYKLNGKTVRLRDINELFMDTGLGRDGYSMVSQGKIADMVSNKSAQRRDMLEEAAGISHFRYRRSDALRRLNQAEDNLVRLRDILAELESRVEPLRKQSEKAQKFLVLAEQKKGLEIGLWLYTIDDLKARLKEQEHKIDLATSQYHAAEGSLEEIEQAIEDAMEQSRSITVEIEGIRNSISGLEEQAAGIRSEIAVHRNSVLLKQENIKRIQEEMRNASLERTSIEEKIADTGEFIEGLNLKETEKREQMQKNADRVNLLTERSREADQDNQELLSEIRNVSEQLAAARIKKSAAQSSLEEIESRGEQTAATLAERNSLLASVEQEMQQADLAVKEAEENVTSLQNAIQGYQMRVGKRAEKLEAARNQRENLRRTLEQQESRARMLDDLEKNMEGYNGSVKIVTREARRGTLRGIHGPLSKLITVPEEYSAAIETALGGAVQFIVVDTEEDAKRAIQYLKQNRGGRATFLPISAIRGRDLQESGLQNHEGYVGIASDLVRADSKYANIVRAQLARTVVVEDMESAISLGRKTRNRFKIVTLDGQTINAGGSMTGGSRTRNAGILSRSGEIEALKKEVQAGRIRYEQAEAALEQADSSYKSARAEFEGAQADLGRAKEERIKAEGQRSLVKGQYDTVVETLRSLEEEQKTAKDRVAALRREEEEAIAAETAAEQKQTELDSRSADLTSHLDGIRLQIEEAAQESVRLDRDLLEITKDREAAEETLTRLRESTSLSAGHDEKRREEIRGYETEIRTAEEEIVSMEEQLASLKTDGDTAREKITALSEERSKAEAESTRLRAEERSKTEERERISVELSRLEERRENMRRDYDATENKLYDEYQLTRREAEGVAEPSTSPTEDQRALREVRGSIKALGSVNVGAIEEYKEVSERYEFMNGQITDVETSKQELLELIKELTDNMAVRFREQFDKINNAFGRTFTDLFGGGKAELKLEDESDLLESPIQIRVQPPGKNVQNIDLLSGGEKGLAAIALLFAILKITPAPFCIFDEVEAALDDVNVGRFAQYERSMSQNIQFITITHRRGTMEEADVMYGVTMEEEGVSKLLELQTTEMAKELGLD